MGLGTGLVTGLITPDFSVSINGIGLSDSIKDRVVSIHTSDEAGIVSDSCEIELDDYDDALSVPKSDANMSVSLGYKETGLTKIGSYYVEEVRINGLRRTIKIRGHALNQKMKSQVTKQHDESVQELINGMAGEYGLDPSVSDEFSDLNLENLPQFGESDINYLTRISQRVGAVSKPSDGHLIFTGDMSGKSASGQSLATKYIDISEVSQYGCVFKEATRSESTSGGKIFANWFDRNTGEYHLVSSGDGEKEVELDEIFSSESEALTATKAKKSRMAKSNTKFTFTSIGKPDLFAEYPIVLTGFSRKIPAKWFISRVSHTLDSNGFTTAAELVLSGA